MLQTLQPSYGALGARPITEKSTRATRVGFTKFQLADASRIDRFNAGAAREFEVLVWYPAMNGLGKAKEYLSERDARNLLHINYSIGKKAVANQISKRPTNSIIDIPVSPEKDKYPVIIFSHDLGMLPEYYTKLMEHLAGQGYFVFSINHPYISEACPQHSGTSEGRLVKLRKSIALHAFYLSYKARKKLSGKSYAEKWGITRRLMKSWTRLSQINSDTVADRTFLLDFLSKLDFSYIRQAYPYHIFAKRLDLQRVAAIGHGWGGCSSVSSLVKDIRVKAAVNLDGFQFGNVVQETLVKPLLMIYSTKNAGINEGVYFSSSEYECHTVEGTHYRAFSDWHEFRADRTQKESESFELVLNLTSTFLDTYLKKSGQDIAQSHTSKTIL